jgi:hypothetical protein
VTLARATFVLALLGAASAAAHERSASYSTWILDGDGAEVVVRLSALEASRLPWPLEDSARLGDYLTERLRLLAGDTLCGPVGPARSLATVDGQVAVEWRVRCPRPGPLSLESDVLLDVAPSHIHFARVRRPDGDSVEGVLSESGRRLPIDRPAPPSLLGAVRMGWAHILSGWDHLAFVAALLLLGGGLADVARVVTGFTLAHSATLAVAVLGWVRPAQAPVEALIGLTIALVAVENCWLGGRRTASLPWGIAGALGILALAAAAGLGSVPALTLLGLALFTGCHMTRLGRAADPVRLRWQVAFAFGLLHGFGFASALADGRLAAAALARTLLGFNTGVELGQLAVVAAALPLVSLARARRPALLEVGSAAVTGLGVFWFVTRAFG